ncbi:MAG: hypothetical protein NUV69_00530 [Candidatus Curtissbacteria bacterium]|nr:hypothetical protein [Candidatus Curtissbacteria bacterium]
MQSKKHILCVCEHGNNRSVTMAWLLKYVEGFETLTAGLKYHSPETLRMLFEWADVITVPEERLLSLIPEEYKSKVKFYDIGPDKYPRPHNKDLLARARALFEADKIVGLHEGNLHD